MMQRLLVLDNLDLCLLGRQGEAVASHHFVGLQILGCPFLISGPLSLSTVGHLHLRTQACSQAHFGVQEELPPPIYLCSIFRLMVCHLGRKGAAGNWGGPFFQVLF